MKRLSLNKKLLKGGGSRCWSYHANLGIMGCQSGYGSHFWLQNNSIWHKHKLGIISYSPFLQDRVGGGTEHAAIKDKFYMWHNMISLTWLINFTPIHYFRVAFWMSVMLLFYWERSIVMRCISVSKNRKAPLTWLKRICLWCVKS